MTNSEIAAWWAVGAAVLQALLSGGAVIVAVHIATRSEKSAEHAKRFDRQDVARDWCIQLLPLFDEWQAMARAWLQLIAQGPMYEWMAMIRKGDPAVFAAILGRQRNFIDRRRPLQLTVSEGHQYRPGRVSIFIL